MQSFILCLLVAIAILVPVLVYMLTKHHSDIELYEGQREYEGNAGGLRAVEKKPEGMNSLQRFLKSFKEGNEDGLLYIVRLYCFGLHPEFAPSKLTGMRLINRIAIDWKFSEKLKKICKVIFEDSAVMVYDDVDSRNPNYYELPDDIIETVDSILDYQMKNSIKLHPCTTNVTYTVDRDYEVDETNDIAVEEDALVIENSQEIVRVHNDSQNVHNHSVGNSCKIIVEQLTEKNISSESYDEAVVSFLNEMRSIESNSDVLQKVTDVLDTLSTGEHSKFLRSEQEIFVLVWNRVRDAEESKKEDMLKILIDNLESCVEYGTIVCSTGKITRMLSTFDAIDDQIIDIKPDWVIKEEISNIASKTRDVILKGLSKEDQRSYDSGEREDLSDQMIKQFMEECKSAYVDTNIMSESALDLLVQDYLEAF